MDLGFHMRGQALDGATPAALDFRTIVAGLAAAQARTAGKAAARQLAGIGPETMPRDAALATLFLNEPGWPRSAAALRGSFDAGLAAKFAGSLP